MTIEGELFVKNPMMKGANPFRHHMRLFMIDTTLLLDMMVKYIQQNDIKALMRVVLMAVESTKD